MEAIICDLDYHNFDNYITICLGLHFFTIGVYDFVLDKIKTEHNILYKVCASGVCTKQNCSKNLRMFRDWCKNCSDWKSELQKLKSNEFRHWKDIKWSQLSSSDWPQSIDEMAKVFVKNTSIDYRHGIFYDFGAVMSILINMNIFTFDKITLQELLRIRNDYYGHNYKTSIDNSEKNMFFKKLLHFIKLPTVCKYQSAQNSILALEELQNTEHLSQKLLKRLLDKDVLNNVHDVIMHNVQRYVSSEKAIVARDEMTANTKLYADFESRLDELIVQDVKTDWSGGHLFRILNKFKIRHNHMFRLLLLTTLFVVLMRPTTDPKGI